MSDTIDDTEITLGDLYASAPEQIPGSFKLFGHEVEIVLFPGLIDECGAFGLWVHKDLKILLDPDVPASNFEHALYHEITHAILDLTGHMKLSQNERFVDCVGGALAQVCDTLNRPKARKRRARRAAKPAE